MWKPVLEGHDAQAALDAIRAVAVDVAATSEAVDAADRTLFWAYATSLVDEPFAHAAYDASLDDVIASLRTGVALPCLYDGGLAGIGFTLAHVLDGGAEDVLEVIDEALIGVLAERWTGSLDLAQGIVGLGVYFLERLHHNGNAALAADGLDRVVRLLDRTAWKTDLGTTWLTTTDVMPESYRARYANGYHDCGVAHGVPGMIGFLARTARQTGDDRAFGLSIDAGRWLASQRRSAHNQGRFPTMVAPLSPDDFARFSRLGTNPGIEMTTAIQRRSRAAWCYGDPGIAAATWEACPQLARETAAECAVRDPATTGVCDTGLCHGAAGLAHLSNRFYQATGDAAHGDAARAWYRRTLAMRSSTVDGAGGFASYRGEDAGGRESYVPSLSLLEGAIGVALSLCSAISPTAPSWDRLLLCECNDDPA